MTIRTWQKDRRIMAKRNRIPGTYEIWQQYAGDEAHCILSLHNRRDVENVMEMFLNVEQAMELKTAKVDGGFFSFEQLKRRRTVLRLPVVHYWFEEVMPDDARIDAEITDWLAVAAATAAAEVREQEQAASADFQRDAG